MTETAAGAQADGSAAGALVWDWSVRLFHWTTVALIPMLWLSAENGAMDWHRRFGLTLMGLLIFRLYWGVAGMNTARFQNFVKGPKAITAYIARMKRPYTPAAGHNPLGALSVIALLAALTAQITAGLFAVDVDGIESGPLSSLISFKQGRAAAEFHEFFFNVLLALIVLHIAAVAYYFIALKTNLVRTMVTGRRKGAVTANAGPFPLTRFLIGAALAVAAVTLVQL
ncbi:cytochrome b/b6 domain-containing protein [Hyphococcus sp.]|uniref:cytochrome b/b6 domain-containing protein n=1 Tax=Hyphococcus sp. TaxID=2038636 RepID=UPI0035C78541